MSSISALDGQFIEINGIKVSRHPNFRVMTTLNGEAARFTAMQRNILSTEVLSRFRLIAFPEMERSECNQIFHALIPQNIPNFEKVAEHIADIHFHAVSYYAESNSSVHGKHRGQAAITLRNFNSSLFLMEKCSLEPRDACSIAYIAQLPMNERSLFADDLNRLGLQTKLSEIKAALQQIAQSFNICPHEQFLDAATNAVLAAQAGLHSF
jgi:hypothetical protein